MTARTSETWFRCATAGLVTVAIVVRSLLHVAWQDEMHVWAVAQKSSSVAELLWNSRYDGHCKLWYLCLLGLDRVFGRYEAVQVFHALIAAGSIGVVLWWSPFSRLQKVLFALGYFAFYEYAVIARCYAIGLLALCMACAAWTSRPAGRSLLVGLALLLLTQSSFFGVVLALPMAFAWWAERVLRWRELPHQGRLDTWLPPACAVAGAVLTALQTVPPPDSQWSGWTLYRDFTKMRKTLSEVAGALIPIPEPHPHFWNTNLLYPVGGGPPGSGAWYLGAIVGTALLAGFALVLARHRGSLVIWLAGAGGTMAFTYVKHPGDMRQHGTIFLALVAACWIARAAKPPAGAAAPRARALDAWRDRMFTGVLVAQAIGGVLCAAIEARVPFSASAACADYLRENGLDRLPVVSDRETAVPVAARLEKPFYYPRSGKWDRSIEYSNRRARRVSDDAIVASARDLGTARGSDGVVLLDRPLEGSFDGVELLATFPPGVLLRETYFVYRVRRAP